MKIKSTSRGNPAGPVSKSRGQSSGGEKGRVQERKEVADTVTLSTDAIAAGGIEAVESVDAVSATNADGRRALPDPRETGRAILEKELASVFREIYL